MNIVKKFGVGFYLGVVAVILGIVAVCMYSSNIANAYFTDRADAAVIGCSIGAILMIAVYLVAENFSGKNKAVDFIVGLLPAGASFCLFTAFCKFLQTRVYSMAIIYGSDPEATNELAHSAMAQAIATLIIFFIAAVVIIVAAYFTAVRQKKTA